MKQPEALYAVKPPKGKLQKKYGKILPAAGKIGSHKANRMDNREKPKPIKKKDENHRGHQKRH